MYDKGTILGGMKPMKWTPEERGKAIDKAIDAGWTLAAIARSAGIKSPSNIGHARRRDGEYSKDYRKLEEWLEIQQERGFPKVALKAEEGPAHYGSEHILISELRSIVEGMLANLNNPDRSDPTKATVCFRQIQMIMDQHGPEIVDLSNKVE